MEWSYQLSKDADKSNILRFIHFNLNREDLANPVYISSGEGEFITIKAPYAKKTYSSGSEIVLNLEDSDANSKTITIK